MTKIKAGEIMEILVNLDYLPTLDKLPGGSYKIIVATQDGVLADTLKGFQDANGIICKARVIDIT